VMSCDEKALAGDTHGETWIGDPDIIIGQSPNRQEEHEYRVP
jgi:hypothetical protein